MMDTVQKKWIRLDNAAKIYPAAKSRKWIALFRLSATLKEPVDPQILAQAQKSVLARFYTFSLKLRRGLFWYYLEENEGAPDVQPDVANPCVRIKFKQNKGFGFRVRYHQKRIAVEIFHVLTDGTGGLVFLKTLVAEYLRLKYGADIPRGADILDCTLPPLPEESEDSFVHYATGITRSRAEENAFCIRGTDEPAGFVNVVTGSIPVGDLLTRAREKGVTLTEYLASVLILSILALQQHYVRRKRKWRPVKVSVPVNLRRFFPTHTLRNFSSYVNPGVDPRYGEYSFDEVLVAVHHFMGSEVNEKFLSAKFSTNVKTEQNKLLRATPLFLKNIMMKIVFQMVGERKTSTTFSNLGPVRLPPAMEAYVGAIGFMLGPLSRNRVSCGAVTYKDTLRLSFTRRIKESWVEHEFFTRLVRLGVPVLIESNQRW